MVNRSSPTILKRELGRWRGHDVLRPTEEGADGVVATYARVERRGDAAADSSDDDARAAPARAGSAPPREARALGRRRAAAAAQAASSAGRRAERAARRRRRRRSPTTRGGAGEAPAGGAPRPRRRRPRRRRRRRRRSDAAGPAAVGTRRRARTRPSGLTGAAAEARASRASRAAPRADVFGCARADDKRDRCRECSATRQRARQTPRRRPERASAGPARLCDHAAPVRDSRKRPSGAPHARQQRDRSRSTCDEERARRFCRADDARAHGAEERQVAPAAVDGVQVVRHRVSVEEVLRAAGGRVGGSARGVRARARLSSSAVRRARARGGGAGRWSSSSGSGLMLMIDARGWRSDEFNAICSNRYVQPVGARRHALRLAGFGRCTICV